MPYVLTIAGLMLIISGVRDTYAAFGSQLKKDFMGDGSQKGFIWWIAALVIVGSIGYVEKLKGFSTAFLALVIIAMVINDKGGVFKKFTDALTLGPIEAATPAGVQAPAGTQAAQTQTTQSGNNFGLVSGGPLDSFLKWFRPDITDANRLPRVQ